MKKINLILGAISFTLLFGCSNKELENKQVEVTFKYMKMINQEKYQNAEDGFSFIESGRNYSKSYTFETNHVIETTEWENIKNEISIPPIPLNGDGFWSMSIVYTKMKDVKYKEDAFGIGTKIESDLVCYFTTWG